MKAMAAFLADAAIENGDGTFDVRRGGITDFLVVGFPGVGQFTMVARIQLDPTEALNLHR